ncbi:unnamed protein product, partial [Mesorhabditis spiculigera]
MDASRPDFPPADVLNLPHYHGLLPREDIAELLVKEGQFLIRISEPEAEKQDKEIIISFFQNQGGDDDRKSGRTARTAAPSANTSGRRNSGKEKKGPIKHMIVHFIDQEYSVDQKKKFKTFADLIDNYATKEAPAGENERPEKSHKCRLDQGIPRQIWEYEHKDVHLEKKLGNGEFGEVWKGQVMRKGTKPKLVDVAIKLAKGETTALKKKRKEIMLENRMMRDLLHPNVVRAYGVAVLQNPIYILLELINGGDLLKFLKSPTKPKKKDLKKLVFQAACGIEFIHQKEVIHRDLAARNCLYDGDRLRISDFGLSQGAFSYKSDVWAFGCLVVEIYSYGDLPYAGKSNAEVREVAMRGGSPKLPEQAPTAISTFFNEFVWADEKKRAGMTGIVDLLATLGNFQRPTPGTEEDNNNIGDVSLAGTQSVHKGNPDKAIEDDDDKTAERKPQPA